MNDGVTYEEELLARGKILRTNVGVSMLPLLREGRDVMIIERFDDRLKKYDVPLYRRGEAYVLHRIIKVKPDGYDIIGDNCVSIEREPQDQAHPAEDKEIRVLQAETAGRYQGQAGNGAGL